MGIHWTEEEAKAAGFTKGPNGQWEKQAKARRAREVEACHKELVSLSPSNDSGEVSRPKRSVRSKSKRSVADKKGGEEKGEAGYQRSHSGTTRGAFRILITSYRVRDFDPDNLCPKWYIDELVKAQVLPDDTSRYILKIEKEVRRVTDASEEKTIIDIFRLEKETAEFTKKEIANGEG